MHLLVSVRDAREASAALAGGADIVDAKEPASGALGAVAPATLEAIAHAIPASMALSAALGEGDGQALAGAIAATPVLPARRGWFVKFALHSEADADRAIGSAVETLRSRTDSPRLILARYADQGLRDVVSWLQLAAGAGAWGALVDTSRKDGRSLFDFVPAGDLGQLAHEARRQGLRLALAGGLGQDHLGPVVATGAHVMGVRGAVCDGGRIGLISEARVNALSRQLRALTARRAPGALLASPP